MALSLSEESGTQTATINTEHTLNGTSPDTTDCILTVKIDMTNMANGDVTEIRIKDKVKSGGTLNTVHTFTLTDAPSADDKIWESPAYPMVNGFDVTLKQIAGTGRDYDWALTKVV